MHDERWSSDNRSCRPRELSPRNKKTRQDYDFSFSWPSSMCLVCLIFKYFPSFALPLQAVRTPKDIYPPKKCEWATQKAKKWFGEGLGREIRKIKNDLRKRRMREIKIFRQSCSSHPRAKKKGHYGRYCVQLLLPIIKIKITFNPRQVADITFDEIVPRNLYSVVAYSWLSVSVGFLLGLGGV